jgi:hypothetical protein
MRQRNICCICMAPKKRWSGFAVKAVIVHPVCQVRLPARRKDQSGKAILCSVNVPSIKAGGSFAFYPWQR